MGGLSPFRLRRLHAPGATRKRAKNDDGAPWGAVVGRSFPLGQTVRADLRPVSMR